MTSVHPSSIFSRHLALGIRACRSWSPFYRIVKGPTLRTRIHRLLDMAWCSFAIGFNAVIGNQTSRLRASISMWPSRWGWWASSHRSLCPFRCRAARPRTNILTAKVRESAATGPRGEAAFGRPARGIRGRAPGRTRRGETAKD